ncbi:MAG: glycosyltransferase family 1 protein, partial [Pseudomonadota bacterium]
GWLVPPDNAPALAEAMLEALGDPEARRARAEAARQHVHDRFSIGAMTQGNLAVYRQLLNATP